jgi:hypothetical protein
LQVPRKSLAGFQGGRAYTSADGTAYGLLVPYRQSFGPLGGANSKLTADGFNALDVMREVKSTGAVSLARPALCPRRVFTPTHTPSSSRCPSRAPIGGGRGRRPPNGPLRFGRGAV